MSGKGLIWGGMFIGSFIGSILPYIWDGGIYSYTIWSTIGGIAGVYLGFKFAKSTGAL